MFCAPVFRSPLRQGHLLRRFVLEERRLLSQLEQRFKHQVHARVPSKTEAPSQLSPFLNKCDVTLSWLQVALGKQQKVRSYLDNSEGLAEGKNSKLAMSAYMPDPALNITTPSGEPTPSLR